MDVGGRFGTFGEAVGGAGHNVTSGSSPGHPDRRGHRSCCNCDGHVGGLVTGGYDCSDGWGIEVEHLGPVPAPSI